MLNRSEFDWGLFDTYRKMNVREGECENSFVRGADMLGMWEKNKSRWLAELFPEHQLVMERPIRYERNLDEMRRQMCDLLDEFHSFTLEFRQRLQMYMDPESHYGHRYLSQSGWTEYGEEERCLLVMESMFSWFNLNQLLENEIRLPYLCNRYELDIAGHKLMLQHGMKLMKTLGKVCSWIGMDKEFEEFRIRQSQVTNAKLVTGTACLSIHPLDFATASDNANGWSSCMSWQECGCYRLGTVEMMNSPMVICSYIKSDKQQMTIAEPNDWNSKKWRAWIIVNRQNIMVNRHYPYHSDPIAKFMVEWVRELVAEKLGWHYSDEISTDLMETMYDAGYRVHYETNFMYNDVGDDDVGVMTTDKEILDNWHEYISFSGPAQCMWCGDEIEFHDNQDEADRLGCASHRAACEDCGCDLDEGDIYYGPNGEVWCSDCWGDHCCQCDECGDTIYVEDSVHLVFPLNERMEEEYYQAHKNDKGNPIVDSMRNPWRPSYPHTFSGGEICVCRACAARRHSNVGWVRFNDGSGDWSNQDPERSVVPDVENTTLEDVLALFEPRGYAYLNRNDYFTWDSYTEEQRQQAEKIVKDFYEQQWAAFGQAQSSGRRWAKARFLQYPHWIDYEGE